MQGAHYADRRLGVVDRALEDPAMRFLDCYPVHFENFRGLGCRWRRREPRSEVEVNRLAQDARRGRADAQARPVLCDSPGFFDELALCRRKRWLVRLELARGDFPQVAIYRVAMLPQPADSPLRIERDDRRATGVMNDLELRAMAVRQGDIV